MIGTSQLTAQFGVGPGAPVAEAEAAPQTPLTAAGPAPDAAQSPFDRLLGLLLPLTAAVPAPSADVPPEAADVLAQTLPEDEDEDAPAKDEGLADEGLTPEAIPQATVLPVILPIPAAPVPRAALQSEEEQGERPLAPVPAAMPALAPVATPVTVDAALPEAEMAPAEAPPFNAASQIPPPARDLPQTQAALAPLPPTSGAPAMPEAPSPVSAPAAPAVDLPKDLPAPPDPMPVLAPLPAAPSDAPRAAVPQAAFAPAEPRSPLAETALRALRKVVVAPDEVTRVQLRPAGLGLIEMELSRDAQDKLHLSIRVQNPMVLAALRQDRATLDGILAAHVPAPAQGGQTLELAALTSAGEPSGRSPGQGAFAETGGQGGNNQPGNGQPQAGGTPHPLGAVPEGDASAADPVPPAQSQSIDILI